MRASFSLHNSSAHQSHPCGAFFLHRKQFPMQEKTPWQLPRHFFLSHNNIYIYSKMLILRCFSLSIF